MPAYRLYTLTPDKHIQAPPEVVECADDEAAIEQAKQILDGHTIEVWQKDRRVIQLEPKS
jgi:hypothetical protein